MRVTREEYLDLADDGFKYDVIEGVMVMSPSADFFHGKTYGEIFSIIRQHLKIHPLGYLTQETDVFLPDGGDPLRPDISFILNEKKYIIKTHIHGVPDLIVEVLSPATEHRDLGIKAERYLKNGVREYWIADPNAKTLRLWINKGEAWDKKSGDSLDSVLLSGLTIRKSDIWD